MPAPPPPRPIDATGRGDPRWSEVSAVVVTGILHLLCKPLGLQSVYIVGAIAFWFGVLLATAARRPPVVREWGFRVDNLGSASRASAAVFLPVVAAMVVLAHARDTLTLPSSVVLTMLLYPTWGLVQQFLVQALLVSNLAKGPLRGHRGWLIVAGGLLFSLVHAGNPLLMVATALVGAAFVWLYLRYRNLWPLGLFHGWLASLFYRWFLNRDPLVEIFGPLFDAVSAAI